MGSSEGEEKEKISEMPENARSEPATMVIQAVGDNLENESRTICEVKENEEKKLNVEEKRSFLQSDSVDPSIKKETLGNPEEEDVKKVCMKSESIFLKEEVLYTINDQIKSSLGGNLVDGVFGDVTNPGSLECLTKKSSFDEELKMQPEIATPLLSLPEFLTDQTNSGTLEQQLGSQFFILTLDYPAGTKALLHCDKLLGDQGMVSGQVLKVSARRVQGFEEFDYQVTHASLYSGLAVDEDGTELCKFAEDKLEEEMLDKELEMFKEK